MSIFSKPAKRGKLANMIFRVIVFCLAVLPIQVFACSCWDPEPEEYLQASTLIFKGIVESVEKIVPTSVADKYSIATIPDELGSSRAKFKLTTSYKGPESKEIDIEFHNNSASCGWDFSVGKEVTVFADGNARNGFKTSMCMMFPYAYSIEHGDNRYKKAIDAYRKKRNSLFSLLRNTRKNQVLLREQATFFVRNQDYPAAELAFNQILKLRPKDLSALVGRADARYKQGAYELALADYQAIQKLDIQNSTARHGKTFALLKLGRIQELGDDRDFSGYENDLDHSSFAGLNLAGANFRGAKLSNTDFSGADLSNADFSESDIHSSNFKGAKLSHAKFRNLKSASETQFNHADLRHADFGDTVLFATNFDNAILDDADFSRADMRLASFEGASINNTKLHGKRMVSANLRGLKFVDQDLSGADFRGADLRGTIFQSTNLKGAIFGVAEGKITNLQDSDLSKANLTDVDWGPVIVDCHTKLPYNLEIAKLLVFPIWTGCKENPPRTAPPTTYRFPWGIVLQGIDASNSYYVDGDLSRFRFQHSNFDNSDFSHATLIGLDIQGGSYNKANFEYTNLTNAHFTAVNFTEASFAHADLSNAKLREVDFSSANLEEAKLTGLCFDVKSKWPEGFDPLAAGAKLCE
ncbi:pentapeptide repeat-containing protein [Methylomonas sp. BW4-1]|uniref:pentapeptide repeat-containing protein n=1 Tax=Methylomonas sp. BW4-1 TaxID=3376685 RepID=UPI004042F543